MKTLELSDCSRSTTFGDRLDLLLNKNSITKKHWVSFQLTNLANSEENIKLTEKTDLLEFLVKNTQTQALLNKMSWVSKLQKLWIRDSSHLVGIKFGRWGNHFFHIEWAWDLIKSDALEWPMWRIMYSSDENKKVMEGPAKLFI